MKRFWVAALFVAVTGLFTGVMAGEALSAGKKPPMQVIPSTDPALLPDMSIGSPKAKIVVVEYASLSCPHCAHWHHDVFPAFHDKYIATGKVRFIYREVATQPQVYALTGYRLARCAVARSADQTDATPYFAVVDIFYRGLDEFRKTRSIDSITAEVLKTTGMTNDDFMACVRDEAAFESTVKTMEAHMTRDGVTGTPTFFVNGKETDFHSIEEVDAAIAAASKAR